MIFLVGTFGLVVPAKAQSKPRPAAGVAASADATGPTIEFASPTFDFGKVKQGAVVRHDFVFKNTGGGVLEISDVHPGCGCTTAGNWDRRVEPGRTGVITLEFNSAGFSGTVHKLATVTCNDPRQPTINLQIKGDVWTPITVAPTLAVFTVSSETETSETKVVRIVNQLEEPITLSGLDVTSPTFRAELDTVKPGKEFELKITTVPPFTANSSSATINLRTSSSDTPTIVVLAQLILQQPVVATPDRITLRPGPLSVPTNIVVTIRNNGKNALTLSDPSINVPGGDVSIQEIQGGKLFQVTVKLPAGFEPKPDERIELAVRSNHPKFPVVRVPVMAIRPVAPTKSSE